MDAARKVSWIQRRLVDDKQGAGKGVGRVGETEMIDINELRRLTQKATPGPWKILPIGHGSQKFAVADSEFLSILTVTDEGEATFGTVYDDADAKFIAAANPAAISELLDRLEAAEQTAQDYLGIDREKAQIAQHLEAAEKARDNANAAAAGVALHAGAMQARLEMVEKERDALRAKVEQMERQEPVRHEFQGRDGAWYPFIDQRHYENTVADGTWPIRALYALPGAKGE